MDPSLKQAKNAKKFKGMPKYQRPVAFFFHEFTLPGTNIFAPENRPKPKRKRSSSNHPFPGGENVSFRENSMYSVSIRLCTEKRFASPMYINRLWER